MKENIKEMIKKLELELIQPEVRKSIDKLNLLIDDDFIEFGSSGKQYNKNDILKCLPNERKTNFKIYDFKITELSLKIVLATYRVEKEDVSSGETTFSLRSSIWKENEGQWRIVFHQGTPSRE